MYRIRVGREKHCQVRSRYQASAQAQRFSLAKLANSLQVGLVKAAARLLPEQMMSDLAGRASTFAGVKGGQLPGRTAAMYGMMASLPNRGDLDAIVLDLLDRLTRVDEDATAGQGSEPNGKSD